MEGDIDEKDFLDRADLLCSLGHTVLISNYRKYYKLIEYFSNYTKARMGLIIGVNNLLEIFDDKYYRNLNGGILEAFGILFTRDLKIYLYPYKPTTADEQLNSDNIPIHPRLRPLYDYLLTNKRVKDLQYNEDVLHIFSRDVLTQIKNCEEGGNLMFQMGLMKLLNQKTSLAMPVRLNKKRLLAAFYFYFYLF